MAPILQANRYRLGLVDTCGSTTLPSDFHKTMHLTINQGVGQTWNLIWSHYEGFTFGTYNIYRGTTPSNISLLTSIASNLASYTDLAPPAGLLYYQIEVVSPAGCSPAKSSYDNSRSNIMDNGEGTGFLDAHGIELRFEIYPNPNNGQFFLSMFNTANNKSIIEITNSLRQVVSIEQITLRQGNQNHTMNLANIKSGIYFVRIGSTTKRLVIK